MTEPKTHTLDAPGAVLYYDVRSNDASTKPVLLVIGSPMGAEGFVTLAGHFTDRTVVTYDPRGAGRSKRTDGATETAVEEQADDLHRLIDALGAAPADIFASSGGAVNALALAARHPEQIRTLVAHEPPSAQDLPDREQVLAVVLLHVVEAAAPIDGAYDLARGNWRCELVCDSLLFVDYIHDGYSRDGAEVEWLAA